MRFGNNSKNDEDAPIGASLFSLITCHIQIKVVPLHTNLKCDEGTILPSGRPRVLPHDG